MTKTWDWKLLAVLLLALALRLPLLNGSFWLDEAAQAMESARPLSQQLDIAYDFQPPLLHLIVHVALGLGQSEWWLRTVAALIPGLITLWCTYQIGMKKFSPPVALASTLLLATSSLHIFYSQELRPYSLAAMWAAASWYFLLQATEAKKLDQQSWVRFTFCSIGGIFSTYLYPFVLVGQSLYVVLHYRRYFRQLLYAGFAISLSFLLWLPKFQQQLTIGQATRADLPGWEAVVSFNQVKGPVLVVGKFIFGILDLSINPFFAVFTLVISFLVVWLISTHRASLLKSHFRFIGYWLLVPAVLAWLVSFVIPVIQPKRLLMLLPAFYLSVSYLSLQLRDAKKYLLIGLLLIVNLTGLCAYWTKPALQREDWRSLYSEITEKYPSQSTLVLFAFPEPFAPWLWYDQAGFPSQATEVLLVDEAFPVRAWLEPALDRRYVLVFDYLSDLTDPQHRILKTLQEYGFQEVGAIDRPLIGPVRIYTKSETRTT